MTEFANSDSRKLAGFGVAWVEKWKIFKLLTLILVHFFAICRELVKKTIYPKRKYGSPAIQAS